MAVGGAPWLCVELCVCMTAGLGRRLGLPHPGFQAELRSAAVLVVRPHPLDRPAEEGRAPKGGHRRASTHSPNGHAEQPLQPLARPPPPPPPPRAAGSAAMSEQQRGGNARVVDALPHNRERHLPPEVAQHSLPPARPIGPGSGKWFSGRLPRSSSERAGAASPGRLWRRAVMPQLWSAAVVDV